MYFFKKKIYHNFPLEVINKMPRVTSGSLRVTPIRVINPQNDDVCWVAPPANFVAAYGRALKSKRVGRSFRKKEAALDHTNIAIGLIYAWRACLLREEVTEENAVACLYLAVKYNEHPCCADAFIDQVTANNITYLKKQSVEKFKSTTKTIWKRLAMRCHVTTSELNAARKLIEPTCTKLKILDRSKNLRHLWVSMREWVGFTSTKFPGMPPTPTELS